MLGVQETLDARVHAALRSVPGFDNVFSITYKDGRVETKAATDELVWKLDSLQTSSVRALPRPELRAIPVQDAVSRVRRQPTASDQ